MVKMPQNSPKRLNITRILLMEGWMDGRTDGLTFSTLTQVEPENMGRLTRKIEA